MSLILSPFVLFGAGLLAVALLAVSSNTVLWLVTFAALALAIWIAGLRKAHVSLVWVLGFFWLAVAGDLGAADLVGFSVSDSSFSQYRETAIYFSLAALLALALGMRLGGGLASNYDDSDHEARGKSPRIRLDLNRVLILYGLSLVLNIGLSRVAANFPSIANPVLAFSLFDYMFLYLIAATVLERQRGYGVLLVVVVAAMVSGMVGYWSSYKEPFYIVVLAMALVRKNLVAREWAIGVVGLLAVIWISLTWTVIKTEYRGFVVQRSLEDRVEWLSDAYLDRPINYADAGVKLLERVGYTSLFSIILTKDSYGSLPKGIAFYEAALQHVLMPRVLFPDKSALDDSAITARLIGWHIGERTSIGVGYTAQAYVDFGFPGMLVPVFFIGLGLGWTLRYFMTRPMPLVIRQAFSTALLFLAFPFAADIDKALGAYLTQLIAMMLTAKFVYPEIAGWLEKRASRYSHLPLISAPVPGADD